MRNRRSSKHRVRRPATGDRPAFRGWVVLVVLLGTMAYAIAEDVTFVSYVPSPRGIYSELRSRDGIKIGSSYFTNPTGLNGGLIVEGNVGIGKNNPACRLDVTDTSCLAALSAQTINTVDLTATGQTTVNDLTVKGLLDVNALHVRTDARIDGNTRTGSLDVVNDATVGGILRANGGAFQTSLGVGMSDPPSGPIAFQVNGGSMLQGETVLNGKVTVLTGPFAAGYESLFYGTVTMGLPFGAGGFGLLDVRGKAVFNNDVTIGNNGALHVDTSADFNQNVKVDGPLTVNNTATATDFKTSSGASLNDVLARLTDLESRCSGICR